MTKVIGKFPGGNDAIGLDVDVKQRKALLEQVIDIHRSVEASAAPGKREQQIKNELEKMRIRLGSDTDVGRYIAKLDGTANDGTPIPLDDPVEPAFFQPHQHGPAPITLRRMLARYEEELEKEGAKR